MVRKLSRDNFDAYFASLSTRSQIRLYAAIFFLLAPVGVLASARPADDRPWWMIAAHATLSGLAGVGGAAAFIHNVRWLFVVVPVHLVLFLTLERFDPSPPGTVGAVAIALIGLGYGFFISFVSGEGVAKLRLQTEIGLAQKIHRELVPPISTIGARLELYGRSAPSSAVGGDLLDVIECGGRTVLCVADVAGHGVPAGVVLGMVKAAVRTRLLCAEGDGPLLPEVDRVLGGILRPGMFVTCVSVAIDEAASSYENAGHLPLLRYDARSRTIERLARSGLPLAVGLQPHSPLIREMEQHSFEFLAGDLLVLLTDGYTEVMDPAGNEFGLEPIEAIISNDPAAPLSTLYMRIEEAAHACGPQVDDQTLLLVRRVSGVS